MKLGILDQMPKPKGRTAEETAAHTIEMAQLAESLGYERYWFAEHHATRGMVSSAPEIMMAAVASRTKNLKVGSGGILLPQYSAFKVASQIAQLESLFPGRVEAGVGRSPGGGEFIRKLLADDKPNQMEEYPDKLKHMIEYLDGSAKVRASPRTIDRPKLYSLGLGENSALLAGLLGIGYVFGHFIRPDRGAASFQTYRDAFSPGFMNESSARACVFIICGKNDRHAEQLAQSQDIWLLNVEKGLDSQVPTSEAAEEKIRTLTEDEAEKIKNNRRRMIIGGPETVKAELDHFSNLYQCEDWLVLCNIHDWEEKKRSLERLAGIYL
ncbi:LLM class flavin-dependent oxidoreductase [Salinicoccus hispanicus]|uniref:MsnO8 family LLM class oxidoreductase n=1 Tax=Salinicoccus hispanicus TaxID=157225 RepID=A0A6N8TUY0_9STAP|nr:LLM class flavin-dependent oxidoreductase [Salinicoccus hispanicus]MXQ49694.1 MsnO8 family LLM class oxidoreductase [Salinicoccus hispanicus]